MRISEARQQRAEKQRTARLFPRPKDAAIRGESAALELRVSVAIIAHNYGRFLDECIDGVAAQNITLHEVFVIDDASDDDTELVCERRGMERIYVEHRDVDRSRRTAFERATGDVIMFLDADDVLTADYVRQGLRQFADPCVGVVYSDVEWFGERSGISDYPAEFDRDRLFRENYMHAGSMVRTAALRLANVFEVMEHAAPGHMDWTLWKRIARQGWTAAKQTALYRYRQHDCNMLRTIPKADYFDRAYLATETITLFVPLSGRLEMRQRFFEQLTALTWPHERISLVLFDTSQQPGFSAAVAGWIRGCDFPDVRHVRCAVGPIGLADAERRGVPQTVAEVRASMARIYNWLRLNVATEYVMILEDDIFPEPADVIERLLHSFDEQTDSVAAAYPSRFTPNFVAWRLGSDAREPIPLNQRGEGVEPIGGNGFGCVILRRSMLLAQMFCDEPHAPSGADSHDFDVAFYLQAARQARLCKLDWSIACEHLSASEFELMSRR